MNKFNFVFKFADDSTQNVQVNALSFQDALRLLNPIVKTYAQSHGQVVTEIHDTLPESQLLSHDIVPLHIWNERTLTGGYRDEHNQKTAQYIASNGLSHGTHSTEYEKNKVDAAMSLVAMGRSEWRYLTQWQSGTTCWESHSILDIENDKRRMTCTVSVALETKTQN